MLRGKATTAYICFQLNCVTLTDRGKRTTANFVALVIGSLADILITVVYTMAWVGLMVSYRLWYFNEKEKDTIIKKLEHRMKLEERRARGLPEPGWIEEHFDLCDCCLPEESEDEPVDMNPDEWRKGDPKYKRKVYMKRSVPGGKKR